MSRRHMGKRKTLDDVEQRPRRHLVGVGVRSLDMLHEYPLRPAAAAPREPHYAERETGTGGFRFLMRSSDQRVQKPIAVGARYMSTRISTECRWNRIMAEMYAY